MVVTPFFPYRDCMPVFRYDTRDVVRRLPDEPLTCNLAGVPAAVGASSAKPANCCTTSSGIVTPRDIVEVLEALPAQPWPAQYRAATDGGVLRLTMPSATVAGTTTAEIVRRFAARGIDCVIDLTATDEPLRHVRADLAETTFTTDRTPSGSLTMSLIVRQSLLQLTVSIVATMAATLGAVAYLRRVRAERPAIGTFNFRDVVDNLAHPGPVLG